MADMKGDSMVENWVARKAFWLVDMTAAMWVLRMVDKMDGPMDAHWAERMAAAKADLMGAQWNK
jgi:hypothetical protein